MAKLARRSVLAIALAAGLLGAASGWQPADAQSTADPGDIAALKQAIIRTTANDAETIQVSATSIQVIVTVMDSPLLAATNAEREGEARLIAGAIEEVILHRPALGKVQALHVDYARNVTGKDEKKVIDGVDFRRDPRGTFQLHRT